MQHFRLYQHFRRISDILDISVILENDPNILDCLDILKNDPNIFYFPQILNNKPDIFEDDPTF